MAYRSASDIQDEYQLKTSVYKLKQTEYYKALNAYETKKEKLYGVYFILFGLSAIGVWIGCYFADDQTVGSAFNTALIYLVMGGFVSLFLISHIFVETFNQTPEPNSTDFGCDESERSRYVTSVKYSLVESILEGRVMKVDWDKSTYHTWNMIVSLDEDKKAHEYYAKFFVDDEEATIDVDVREFVAKH